MLRRTYSRTLWLSAVCVLLWAGSAAAQSNPELGDVGAQGQVQYQTQPAPAVAPQSAWGPAPVAADPNAPPAVYAARFPNTDHSLVVGRFGVGFFGVLNLPIGGVTLGAMGPEADFGTTRDGAPVLYAPTIGARYWLKEDLAIEAALGIGISSSGTSFETSGAPAVETNGPSTFGLALHGGVPIVFAAARHFTFEVIPELNVGFATGSIDDESAANLDSDLSGFLLELGARVGAEIHFGFIDIPELALQASVGVHLTLETRSVTIGNTDFSNSYFRFGTSVQGEPWDIFQGNLSAIYYF